MPQHIAGRAGFDVDFRTVRPHNSHTSCPGDKLGQFRFKKTGRAVEISNEFTECELTEIRALILADPRVNYKTLLDAQKWSDGMVRLRTGVVEGPLFAYGDLLDLRHDGSQWTVMYYGTWGS